MARVHRVASSRTIHRCHNGHDILPPEGYAWAAPGFRARPKFACAKHPFRPSQLTTSLVADVYAAQEAWDDALPGIDNGDDLTAAFEEFVSALTDYRDMRQEALDQWEYGNSQLEEYLDDAENALGEVEGQFEFEEYGEPEPELEEFADQSDDEEEQQDLFEQEHAAWEEAVTAHFESEKDRASELIYGVSL